MLTNKQYDILKVIALCWMPLIVAFIGVFLSTWNIPHADQILTTLVALNTLMGGVVKYYKARYDKEKKNAERVKDYIMNKLDSIEPKSEKGEEK